MQFIQTFSSASGRRLATVMLLACGVHAQAQTASSATEATLAPVTVSGDAFPSDADGARPVVHLERDELLLRSRSTLGDTLEGTPGVSSTHFGPNASRPVIRGLDGDRIRLLDNGSASQDVSGLSYDHAVTIEPMLVDRVEVLLGPATLLYGGGSASGVVNVIDNRIQREPLFDAGGGLTGQADASLATGNQEQSGAVRLDAGTQRYTLHADGTSRNTQDVAVPIDLSCTRGGVTTTARRLCNSASQSWGGALGGTLYFDRGYLGAALSSYDANYGTVAQDEVSIAMRSTRLALEGELRGLSGALQSLKAQYSNSDYRHTEFDAAVPGTLFKSQGQELRLQGRQTRVGTRQGALDGTLGLQFNYGEFSADGDEAFAPYSRTRAAAAFAHEQLATGWGHLSAAARLESVQVDSLGHPTLTRFAAASRSFAPLSTAVGAAWNVAPAWQLSTNLGWSERAPKDYELYADGVHVATNAYEVGNAQLDRERSTSVDVGARWKRGADSARVQLFVNEFSNYISLESSGTQVTVNGTAYPEYRYTPVQARFSGMEAQSTLRLLERGQTLDLVLRGDMVRADNLSTGQPLPRIAPLRLGAALQWAQAAWGARLGVDQYAAQDRVPDGQLATAGYTLWNAALTYRTRAAGSQLLWYARLDNLGDTLAYSSTSILTQTAPGRAPLAGRSLKAGLQLTF